MTPRPGLRSLIATAFRVCCGLLRLPTSRWRWRLLVSLGCLLLALDYAVLYGGLSEAGAFDALGSSHVDVIPQHHVTEIEERWGDVSLTSNLRDMAVPLSVHFVWCNSRPFHYRHYLSVLSVYKLIKPTSITFHYDREPRLDDVGYFQFYPDLKLSLPNFFPEPISDRSACSRDPLDKLVYAFKILNANGGIYVDEDVIISRPLVAFRERQLSHSIQTEGTSSYRGVILAAPDVMGGSEVTRTSVQRLLQATAATFTCPDPVDFVDRKNVRCVMTTADVFPVQVWEAQSDFGRLARWVGYGRKATLAPAPNDTVVVPLIVHYVWLGKRQFSFFAYLSLLSSLYVINARVVYVHGDCEPEGELWEKAKQNERVKFIYRNFPSSVFGNEIKKFKSHASDFLRTDLLLRFGGIYLDWDVLWVNPIPEDLRHFDFVACVDWPRTGQFPDVFNMGVLLARKGAEFLRYFLESYRHYLDSHWSYNAIHMPYKVYEKHPNLLYNHRHLQVICAKFKCHPTWLARYQDETVHHLSGAAFDWRRETLALHWTYPDPPEFDSRQELLQASGMFADIGRFVLQAAQKAGFE